MSASFGGGTVIAEDTIGSDGFLARVLIIVAEQDPMSIEEPDLLTVRTWTCFQGRQHRLNMTGRNANDGGHGGSRGEGPPS